MLYIPKAVCVKCCEAFCVDKNDVTLHTKVKGENRHFYSIQSDQWKCPKCGVTILLGFAEKPQSYACDSDLQSPGVTIEV